MRTDAAATPANQPSPLEGYDAFWASVPLVEALRREGGGWAEERLAVLGRLCGGPLLEQGRLANEHPPVLRTHDRFERGSTRSSSTRRGTSCFAPASSTRCTHSPYGSPGPARTSPGLPG